MIHADFASGDAQGSALVFLFFFFFLCGRVPMFSANSRGGLLTV